MKTDHCEYCGYEMEEGMLNECEICGTLYCEYCTCCEEEEIDEDEQYSFSIIRCLYTLLISL